MQNTITTAIATALSSTPVLKERQFGWMPLESDSTASFASPDCTPFVLPSGGSLDLGHDSVLTLTAAVTFRPACLGNCTSLVRNGDTSCVVTRDPFYASSTTTVFVVGLSTVIAWTLLIILLITPRTFTSIRRGTTTAFLPGWGILAALSGRSSKFATGSRPSLQKAAALSVAIAMTIATADTFHVAEYQYRMGYEDASKLRIDVAGSLEIRIIRVISNLFLWLAQVQTLIRLFPRHKEKLIIKWIGFALILSDVIFSCLNSFWIQDPGHLPRKVRADAISALSYLFQLALALLYATWVFYYAVTKRRYAFYHEKMPNICLIALISVVSLLIPVAFFIADILEYQIAGWGDYIRWVGAAAASIVVWEWVERIERVERDEKKDGILGHEVFDGDEMLDNTPSDSRGRQRATSSAATDADEKHHFLSSLKRRLASRPAPPEEDQERTASRQSQASPYSQHNQPARLQHADHPAQPNRVFVPPPQPPPALGSPVDRSMDASAGSIVYAVRYHPVSDTPPAAAAPAAAAAARSERATAQPKRLSAASATLHRTSSSSHRRRAPSGRPSKASGANNPFKRSRKSPPIEVKNATSLDEVAQASQDALSQRGFMRRLGGFAASQSDSSRQGSLAVQQPTVIPAPPRGHTWSPHDARHSPLDIIMGGGTPGVADEASGEQQPAITGVDVLHFPSSTVPAQGGLAASRTSHDALESASADAAGDNTSTEISSSASGKDNENRDSSAGGNA